MTQNLSNVVAHRYAERAPAMPIAPILARFLESQEGGYEVLAHVASQSLEEKARAVGVEPRRVARAVPLRCNETLLVAVLPLTHVIDFTALGKVLGGEPRMVSGDELSGIFDDCEVGCVPGLAQAYGVPAYYDESLFEHDYVVMEAGAHDALLRVERATLRAVARQGQTARFACSEESLRQDEGATKSGHRGRSVYDLAPSGDLRKRIEAIYELPPMPEHTGRLLRLRGNPDASARDLAETVELDPGLTVQMMRYACSPLFGCLGKLDSLHDAISRVLGFDMAMNLALGLATLKPFNNPPDGPLGMRAFWRHATLSAALAQRLGHAMPREQRLKPGIIHLAGLLHNFGYLVFGQLFQPEFFLLNRMTGANPDVPVTFLEKQVLCMGQAKQVICLGHASVGSWLLRSWGLPDEVVVAAREHHDLDYRGEGAPYAMLMLAVDRLLKAHGVGDGASGEIPEAVLHYLGLDGEQAVVVTEELMETSAGLDELIGQGVA